MPLGTWLSGLTTSLSPAKEPSRDAPHTSDAILAELTYQMRLAEDRNQAEEKEQKRLQMGGIDYSWLVTVKPKPYEIPEIERLELDELCNRITPAECSKIIRSFRDAIVRDRKAQEMPRILRAVIHQTIDARPAPSSVTGMPLWLSRSVSSLKSLHVNIRNNTVAVIDGTDLDPEMQERSPSVELSTMRSFIV